MWKRENDPMKEIWLLASFSTSGPEDNLHWRFFRLTKIILQYTYLISGERISREWFLLGKGSKVYNHGRFEHHCPQQRIVQWSREPWKVVSNCEKYLSLFKNQIMNWGKNYEKCRWLMIHFTSNFDFPCSSVMSTVDSHV